MRVGGDWRQGIASSCTCSNRFRPSIAGSAQPEGKERHLGVADRSIDGRSHLTPRMQKSLELVLVRMGLISGEDGLGHEGPVASHEQEVVLVLDGPLGPLQALEREVENGELALMLQQACSDQRR